MTTASSTAARRALLIGIDRYTGFSPLAGCANDVRAMAGLLNNRYCFPAANVTLLLDEAATQEGIRTAVAALIAQVAAGDQVVFQYSGHGSRITTETPAATADGMDETIVPYDSGRAPRDNRDIRDQEIHFWLIELCRRAGHLTLIFDSCHSGHILRDSFGAVGRWAQPDRRPAADLAPLPPAIMRALDGRRDAGPGRFRLPLGARYTLLAGCRSTETSFELRAEEAGGVQHGAFTYYLCQELAKARGAFSARDLFEAAAPRVSAQFASQHPQIEGLTDLQVFGGETLKSMSFVPLRQEQAGAAAVLAAGAACGVGVGSTWWVYPAGTRSAGGDTRPLGRVEVTAVRAVESDARLLEGGLAAAARAIEESRRVGATRFVVETWPEGVSGAAVEELRAAIAGSPVLSLAGSEWDSESGSRSRLGSASGLGSGSESGLGAERAVPPAMADARIYLLPMRTQVGEGDAVPAAGALRHESWAVVGRDGELLMPVRPAAPGVVRGLRENLETRARFKLAMELSDPGGPLQDKVQLTIRRHEAGRWLNGNGGSGHEQAAAGPVFRAGERVCFEVTHGHPAPLYLYLLDFGLSGAISLIYPAMGGEQKPVAADRVTVIGDDDRAPIKLFVPRGFPFPGGGPVPAGGWTETVKLFATTQEADFSPLVQDAVRGGLADGRLSRLLRAGRDRQALRDVAPEPLADCDWTALDRSFRLLP
jgi:hypothetical protein